MAFKAISYPGIDSTPFPVDAPGWEVLPNRVRREDLADSSSYSRGEFTLVFDTCGNASRVVISITSNTFTCIQPCNIRGQHSSAVVSASVPIYSVGWNPSEDAQPALTTATTILTKALTGLGVVMDAAMIANVVSRFTEWLASPGVVTRINQINTLSPIWIPGINFPLNTTWSVVEPDGKSVNTENGSIRSGAVVELVKSSCGCPEFLAQRQSITHSVSDNECRPNYVGMSGTVKFRSPVQVNEGCYVPPITTCPAIDPVNAPDPNGFGIDTAFGSFLLDPAYVAGLKAALL